MLKDRYLADMPIVIAAIDPCFSCTDRLISVTDADKGSKNTMTWPQLHSYSIEWHQKSGIDFSELNKKFKVPGN
jgi:NADH-quinone oxidoreductase subunit D